MTAPKITPLIEEAAVAAESDWLQANGIEPGAEVQEWAHDEAMAMFAAGVEWAARQADRLGVRYLKIYPVAKGSSYMPGCSVESFAGMLRGDPT